MANDPLMSQDEIERLFGQAQADATAAEGAQPAPGAAQAETARGAAEALPQVRSNVAAAPRESGSASQAGEAAITPGDIDYLLTQAQQALDSVNSVGEGDLPAGVTSYRLPELSVNPAATEAATLDLIRDVELDLKIELGRTHMYLEDVLKLRKGSVVPLDKLAGDPVDIYVNGRLIARGEVLVLNDNFCVRVAELIVGTNMPA